MLKAAIPADPLSFIRERISAGKIRWTYHVSMRLRERNLSGELLRASVDSLEIIEAYPDDKYLPSFLVRGENADIVFHTQIATDLEGDNVRVVTMYRPDPDTWTNRSRNRRLTP